MLIRHHFSLCFILLFGISISSLAQDLVYDSSATTECKPRPFKPLYGGGLLKGQKPSYEPIQIKKWVTITAPSFTLPNLVPGVYYSFSSWVKIMGAESALIWANLGSQKNCEATVLAKRGCWTFLKGGIFLTQPLNTSTLYFEAFGGTKGINIDVASASLQPFTEEQWRANQQAIINRERKRDTTITVTDQKGIPLRGAKVKVEQISSGFPFGVAISSMITQNSHYQEWFKKRFTATVFENELKWPSNEPRPGVLKYNISDQMVDFVTKNKIMTRGHNVVWQDPTFVPSWARNLTRPDLQQAVDRRINSVVDRYKNKFIHWDVNNELIHYDFYERKLENPNASLDFYKKVQEIDPNATLFINDFKVVEQCGNTTKGHSDIHNPPYILMFLLRIIFFLLF
ncbi:PREDICTED: uncharacterized protein LOC109151122 isoform X2 [Ipomoea nil]|uniref:uncharacterized protein LOC109151122 isoform X2 n=1 Tax=Ipomoea nil TaxID=35883 RepID=UPI000900A75A|nr:PREDICTED: uncharacterized protein LOC109151122 isoform X2 [Ipomoea nil]